MFTILLFSDENIVLTPWVIDEGNESNAQSKCLQFFYLVMRI